MIELVVARYRERIEWTRNVPAAVRVTIYDKGGDLDPASVPRARVVPLANVGFEAHTYLTHVVAGYPDLAPTTVFCQGHPFDHAPDLHARLRELAAGSPPPGDGFRWLGFIVDTDDVRGRRLFVPWSKNRDRRELRLDEFHRELLGEPAPAEFRFYPGAQFMASAARVRARTLGFYRRALALSESFPDAGHCFERLWDRVLGTTGVDPALLAGAPTRYLKPIRRLAPDAAPEPSPPALVTRRSA